MPLVGSGVHGYTIGSRGDAQLSMLHHIWNAGVAAVADQRYLVEVDTQINQSWLPEPLALG